MTRTSGDKAAPPAPGGIPRRTRLAMGVGGAAASGHGAGAGEPVGAGAGERVLEHVCGPRTPVPFTATYGRGDGKVGTLDHPRGTRWSRLTRDNVDARVWAGVHFRFSDEAGATLGRRAGAHTVERLDRVLPETSDQ